MTPKEAADLAALFILLLETLAQAWAGSEARMRPHERELIHDPLQRIILRNVRAARHLATFSDPLALAFGLLLWGQRVSRIAAARRAPSEKSEPRSEPRRDADGPSATAPDGDAPGRPMDPETFALLFPETATS